MHASQPQIFFPTLYIFFSNILVSEKYNKKKLRHNKFLSLIVFHFSNLFVCSLVEHTIDYACCILNFDFFSR